MGLYNQLKQLLFFLSFLICILCCKQSSHISPLIGKWNHLNTAISLELLQDSTFLLKNGAETNNGKWLFDETNKVLNMAMDENKYDTIQMKIIKLNPATMEGIMNGKEEKFVKAGG